MESFEEREVAGLRIRVDRLLCVGFEDCVGVAPEVFRMDDEGIATFTDDAALTQNTACVIDACRVCPVDALTAFDADGSPVAP